MICSEVRVNPALANTSTNSEYNFVFLWVLSNLSWNSGDAHAYSKHWVSCSDHKTCLDEPSFLLFFLGAIIWSIALPTCRCVCFKVPTYWQCSCRQQPSGTPTYRRLRSQRVGCNYTNEPLFVVPITNERVWFGTNLFQWKHSSTGSIFGGKKEPNRFNPGGKVP